MTALAYSTAKGDELTPEDWEEMSSLFSSSYGRYAADAPDGKAGKAIRMGVGYYERTYAIPLYRIARCKENGRLVAHAIYLQVETQRGDAALVVQLVVSEQHRRKGIASTLLHAIWGFSDFYAWGIVTSNPFTVAALESATFRHSDPAVVSAHIEWIKDELLARVPFLKDAPLRVSCDVSCVNTAFFTDRSHDEETTEELSARMGRLAAGEEWLAVVFRAQPLDDLSSYSRMIDSSAMFVADAYSRMPQSCQPWASQTEDEVDAILRWLPNLSTEARICDFGAGFGRHVNELRKRGFKSVVGIDFATSDGETIISADCRIWKGDSPYDLILCLYDVVGSFVNDADNELILSNIAANLRIGGSAVISVSNFAYDGLSLARRIDWSDVRAAATAVFALPASNTMETSEEFFDERYLLIDDNSHVVCHKEKFSGGDSRLPGEYVVRDRRYTSDEITEMLLRNGLTVVERHFVRTGFDKDFTETTAKEILLVARRN